jgi:(E)-4-hydroxy-3-methylbut-2-enyl-diphosphate synthase
MTNTPTADIEATTLQIKELAKAGSELVRITVNDDKAALAVPKIVKNIRNLGIKVPIV